MLAAIPRVSAGRPTAQVRDVHCVLDGDDCCEWEFTWGTSGPFRDPLPWLGLAGSLLLFTYSVSPLPLQALFYPVIPVPLVVGWYYSLLRQSRKREEERAVQLVEQQQQSEKQLGQLLEAQSDTQAANIPLEQNVRSLTVLHEIGLTISSTLNMDELLQRTLQVIKDDLHFDRAIILIVDAERRVLTRGRSIGGPPEMAALVRSLEIPSDREELASTQALISGEPVLVPSSAQVAAAERDLMRVLGASSFLVVPLTANGSSP